MPLPSCEKLSQHTAAQRKKRARVNYVKNAAGKWVRSKAWRECDYTPEGHLREFDTEEAFLKFVDDRRALEGEWTCSVLVIHVMNNSRDKKKQGWLANNKNIEYIKQYKEPENFFNIFGFST